MWSRLKDLLSVNTQDDIAAGLGGTAAADDQHIQRAPVLVGVQAQTDVTSEDLVLLLGEHRIDLLGGCPGSGAMLLTVPCPALLGSMQADAHDVEPGTDQDGRQAVLRPANPKGVLQGLRQAGQDIRKAASQGLGEEQGCPDNGDIEKQPDQQAVVGLWGSLQQRSSPLEKRKKPGVPENIRHPRWGGTPV